MLMRRRPAAASRSALSASRNAVGGQGEIRDFRLGGQVADQFLEIGPKQWLAAGEVEFGDTEANERAGESVDLLEGEISSRGSQV